MKKYIIIFLIFCKILSFAQTTSKTEFDNGSKISVELLNKIGNKKLQQLGMIWGFLKYYHPTVAAGKYNWDDELFKIIPELSNTSAVQHDKLITNWIKSLGYFKTQNYTTPENLKMKADLDWIMSSGFSKELTDILLKVKNAERKDKNHYVSLLEDGNPAFANENPYSTMISPDAGYRLLSLYRYWNIIQYYFPYRYAIGQDWKEILGEFIPKFLSATDGTDYNLACLELTERINDSHAGIHNAVTYHFFGERIVLLEIVFAENEAVVKNYYDENLGKETGLKIGDIILEINGKTIEKIIADYSRYLPASNNPTKLRNLSYQLLNSNDMSIDLKYLSDGAEKTTTLQTYLPNRINYRQKPAIPFKMIDAQTAYINLGTVKSKDFQDIFEKIKNTKGLIIDMRAYPAEFYIFKLGKYLMPHPEKFARFTVPSIMQPGDFTMQEAITVGTDNKDFYKGKIAILINEMTQSSAEYHTMAFRKSPNAKVFGSQTAGADGDVSYFTLPGKVSTQITGIGIYTPEGSETQRIGIIPDVELKPTMEGIKKNKDEVLEKALEWIES
ncbi:Peptidase family S41 [Chryseobacterium taichungense]|uniref:Peptidase family S41 n=1 Tax=Chryseobacterium taichungense TaxID=295069 RepID=A0A1H7WE75_9FLAO|nr:S41 family peptidase [Chryseobacterium taichungense]SEM19365.1 Peptidase family S41 [Chryseobacterium taichungense]